jgi:hypothetical protein
VTPKKKLGVGHSPAGTYAYAFLSYIQIFMPHFSFCFKINGKRTK